MAKFVRFVTNIGFLAACGLVVGGAPLDWIARGYIVLFMVFGRRAVVDFVCAVWNVSLGRMRESA